MLTNRIELDCRALYKNYSTTHTLLLVAGNYENILSRSGNGYFDRGLKSNQLAITFSIRIERNPIRKIVMVVLNSPLIIAKSSIMSLPCVLLSYCVGGPTDMIQYDGWDRSHMYNERVNDKTFQFGSHGRVWSHPSIHPHRSVHQSATATRAKNNRKDYRQMNSPSSGVPERGGGGGRDQTRPYYTCFPLQLDLSSSSSWFTHPHMEYAADAVWLSQQHSLEVEDGWPRMSRRRRRRDGVRFTNNEEISERGNATLEKKLFPHSLGIPIGSQQKNALPVSPTTQLRGISLDGLLWVTGQEDDQKKSILVTLIDRVVRRPGHLGAHTGTRFTHRVCRGRLAGQRHLFTVQFRRQTPPATAS